MTSRERGRREGRSGGRAVQAGARAGAEAGRASTPFCARRCGAPPRGAGRCLLGTGHGPLVHMGTSPRFTQPRCQPGPHAPRAGRCCSCCAPCPRQDAGSSQITPLTLCLRGQLSSPHTTASGTRGLRMDPSGLSTVLGGRRGPGRCWRTRGTVTHRGNNKALSTPGHTRHHPVSPAPWRPRR